ncbi:MAG: glutamate racemase [Oscillospiraceae bacterium]|jgi:glutamate racemase
MTVGIFDSGSGGLTVVRAFDRLMPDADIVYFGDTGRVPYGTRSEAQLRRFAGEDFELLKALGADRAVVACGTISTLLCRKGYPKMPLEYSAVIEGAAKKAASVSKTGRIAVLGTESTVRNRGFESSILRIRPDASVIFAKCQEFVTLCEEGRTSEDDPEVAECAERLLAPIRGKCDTVILGCTHFPLLRGAISRVLPGQELIDCSYEAVADSLELIRPGSGTRKFYVSGSAHAFRKNAGTFLGYSPEVGFARAGEI